MIDNSSLYRMDPDVPLIVPEVNPDAIDGYRAKNIIANPNCSTAQMVVALKPLHDAATIKRVVVATYQSVSGAGKAGMDELFEQSRNIFVGDANEPVKFTKQIAFNVIPHIDGFLDDGSTKEEWKMVVETKKILDPKIKVTATCVRVPVFVGHSEAINIEFENEIQRRRGAARSCARRRASCWSISARTAATSPRSNASATMRPTSAACARTRRSRTACRMWVRQRQSPQGRGAQRGPDRRAARPQASAEGGLSMGTGDDRRLRLREGALHGRGRQRRGLSLPLPHVPARDRLASRSPSRICPKPNVALGQRAGLVRQLADRPRPYCRECGTSLGFKFKQGRRWT